MSAAILRFTEDDDIEMNSAAVELMFGVPVSDPDNPGPDAIESGIRRRVRYENLHGTTDIDIVGLLTFYAQQDNVGLTVETGTGSRVLHQAVDLDNLPDKAMIIGSDGVPTGVVEIDKLQADATRLMYALAVTAGDDDATDNVAERWVSDHGPEYFGYLAAAALSLMTRHVLAPVLDAASAAGVDLRPGLVRAAGNAESELS